MIKKVIFVSQDEAEQIVPPEGMDMAVISITDPSSKEANLSPLWEKIFRFSFYDIPEEKTSLRNTAILGMSREQAKQIIDINHELKDDQRSWNVVVHCHAGISRSAAIAKFIAEQSKLSFPSKYLQYNKYIYSLLRQVNNGETEGSRVEYQKWLDQKYKEYCEERAAKIDAGIKRALFTEDKGENLS